MNDNSALATSADVERLPTVYVSQGSVQMETDLRVANTCTRVYHYNTTNVLYTSPPGLSLTLESGVKVVRPTLDVSLPISVVLLTVAYVNLDPT
ncbi:hypothetical protein J6590_052985 [Homalodisca vitripennis]|nr:hypothetical protein J6590_052985 [Homalodisca vitripennis]